MRLTVAAVMVLALGCRGQSHLLSDASSDAASSDAADTPAAGGYTLASFPGGFDDHLALPPPFAPTLPLQGEEATREPPGLYQPDSDQFFSYAVLWWTSGAPDLSIAALRSDLAIYYTALCDNPAVTVTLDEPVVDAGADAGAGVARRGGTLAAGSCFGSAVPPAELEVSTIPCPARVAILILLSPQPQASAVWTELRAIRDTFRCEA